MTIENELESLEHPPWHADVAANLEQALRDGSWRRYHGPWTQRLRDELCTRHDLPHARLCCSGTAAVELALKGVGVKAGDEVVLGGYDFPGNFRCVEHLGALPVLVDIGADHGCLEPHCIGAALGTSTKAVLVSHLHSGVAPMREICELAKAARVAVVEDACQAPGAMVDGRLAGTWGDAATFSFGGSKLLTAGRGGAVITGDATCSQRMKIYSERGNDAYPLSELQAAVLLPQWTSLDAQNAKRRESAAQLARLLRDSAAIRYCGQMDDPQNLPSYFKIGLRLHQSLNRAAWIAAMQAEGISVDEGFRGFFRRSDKRCRAVGEFPAAMEAAERGVVLHHSVLLESVETIERIAALILELGVALSKNSAT